MNKLKQKSHKKYPIRLQVVKEDSFKKKITSEKENRDLVEEELGEIAMKRHVIPSWINLFAK